MGLENSLHIVKYVSTCSSAPACLIFPFVSSRLHGMLYLYRLSLAFARPCLVLVGCNCNFDDRHSCLSCTILDLHCGAPALRGSLIMCVM